MIFELLNWKIFVIIIMYIACHTQTKIVIIFGFYLILELKLVVNFSYILNVGIGYGKRLLNTTNLQQKTENMKTFSLK